MVQHPHLDLAWFQDFYSLDHPNSKAGKLSEVRLSDTRLIDLVWIGESGGEQFRTVIRIDAGRGHTPVYHAHWRTNPDGEFELYSANNTQWIVRKNVWIPVQAEYENFRLQTKRHVTLVWNTINKSIPLETFTLKGLDLAEGIPVIDRDDQRQPIVIGTIGADGELLPD